ncbi:uncharacterized protein BDV14DRAFT_195323 [Aspergillus stella-maris]|uniref:uncharacterized protein n=1 Tax=Aspergillus stella-maris TaxID=1810926 RepID=UPI003CCDB7D7
MAGNGSDGDALMSGMVTSDVVEIAPLRFIHSFAQVLLDERDKLMARENPGKDALHSTVQPLVSLASSSRRLRAIVQPYIYKTIHVNGFYRNILLLRTLHTRMDLTDYVRNFVFLEYQNLQDLPPSRPNRRRRDRNRPWYETGRGDKRKGRLIDSLPPHSIEELRPSANFLTLRRFMDNMIPKATHPAWRNQALRDAVLRVLEVFIQVRRLERLRMIGFSNPAALEIRNFRGRIQERSTCTGFQGLLFELMTYFDNPRWPYFTTHLMLFSLQEAHITDFQTSTQPKFLGHFPRVPTLHALRMSTLPDWRRSSRAIIRNNASIRNLEVFIPGLHPKDCGKNPIRTTKSRGNQPLIPA